MSTLEEDHIRSKLHGLIRKQIAHIKSTLQKKDTFCAKVFVLSNGYAHSHLIDAAGESPAGQAILQAFESSLEAQTAAAILYISRRSLPPQNKKPKAENTGQKSEILFRAKTREYEFTTTLPFTRSVTGQIIFGEPVTDTPESAYFGNTAYKR